MVRIDADQGAEVMRGYCGRDEGAGRLGEVALVDGSGRIGPLETVFWTTLIDRTLPATSRSGRASIGLSVRPTATASTAASCTSTS